MVVISCGEGFISILAVGVLVYVCYYLVVSEDGDRSLRFEIYFIRRREDIVAGFTLIFSRSFLLSLI